MKLNETRIGFMGFGHMAQILFQGIDRARIIPRSMISFLQRDAAKMKRNEQKYGITSTGLKNLVESSQILFLCMRPQQAETALRELSLVGGLEGKWIISILAGTKIAFFQKHLGLRAQILRAMPNLASAVGEGMSVLTYSPPCDPSFKTIIICFNGMVNIMAICASNTSREGRVATNLNSLASSTLFSFSSSFLKMGTMTACVGARRGGRTSP